MANKNYYDILGVDKKASKDDIKKAFHKLAHKYHPDKKGGDDARFKEVSEAYSVLSDDKKRAEYDSYGRVFSGAGPGAQGQDFNGFDFSGFQQGFEDMNFGDIFGDIFGGFSGNPRERMRRGSDIAIDMQLTFPESIFGTERTVLVTKGTRCATCEGTGAKPGTEMKTCETCNGKGKIHETRRSFLGSVSVTRACATCEGRGKIPKEKCALCHGSGVVRRQEEIAIAVPPGVDNGEMIRLSGMGEAVQNGAAGDLYVKIHVAPHHTLRREGNNLAMDLNVKLSDALLGAEYSIETLDGPVTLTIPQGVAFGEILRLRGKGVPHERGKRGDLLVKINITLPAKLSKHSKELIENLRQEGI